MNVAAPLADRWSEAALIAALFAVDPAQLGGVWLRAQPGPARTRWLQLLQSLQAPGMPLRRIPHHITDERLLGGLDLTATLHSGRPVAEQGVLSGSHGGIAILAMSERIAPAAAARFAAVLDTGEVAIERDGIAARSQARLGIVLLDEGVDDERAPASLSERCALVCALDGISQRDMAAAAIGDGEELVALVSAARVLLPRVRASATQRRALCAAALACGVASLRAPLFALRVARIAAALDGRERVSDDDTTLAARLVIAPRATQLPMPPEQQVDAEPPPPPPEPPEDEQDRDGDDEQHDAQLDDVVLQATVAALPAGLLALLQGGLLPRAAPRSATSRAGVELRSQRRGRPIGSRPGALRSGARLHLIDTLRAAAPWQPLRKRERQGLARIDVRPEDLRIRRYRQRTQTTLIFVVDASGSAALHRLAEAKGAVELLLADCYARRDQVALIAFRGKGAELLLSPTRSLSRAKRSLAGLPGGGGTPLASGIDAAIALVEQVRRRGDTPLLVLLTDGRANIARDGSPGRPAAERDALSAARALRAQSIAVLLIDSAPTPHPNAQKLALEMRARYLALPHADARTLGTVVQQSMRAQR